ncbi:hypothetical protein T484DRAFT_1919920 [Baffinella frigidus]|nr:hypothetical protein T484DRAFT_1919920 [Cryptophyta sp. CCMP2293]
MGNGNTKPQACETAPEPCANAVRCNDCQIVLETGTADSNKCAHGAAAYQSDSLVPSIDRCCNCAMEDGWMRYADYGCRHCKKSLFISKVASHQRWVSAPFFSPVVWSSLGAAA